MNTSSTSSPSSSSAFLPASATRSLLLQLAAGAALGLAGWQGQGACAATVLRLGKLCHTGIANGLRRPAMADPALARRRAQHP